MEEFITDERTGLRYELVGDYYLIAGEDEPEGRPIGIWGQRHLQVYPQAQGRFVCRAADYRQAERLPCRPQRAGRSIVFSAGKAAFRKRGRNGSSQSGKSNAVGAEDEQHP